MTNEHPEPTYEITIFGGTATVRIDDANRAAVFIEDGETVTVNRIPVWFAGMFRFASYPSIDTWTASHTGLRAYRQDDPADPFRAATDSQRAKIMRAVTTALNELPASVFLEGQVAHLGRLVDDSREQVHQYHKHLFELQDALRVATIAYEAAVTTRTP